MEVCYGAHDMDKDEGERQSCRMRGNPRRQRFTPLLASSHISCRPWAGCEVQSPVRREAGLFSDSQCERRVRSPSTMTSASHRSEDNSLQQTDSEGDSTPIDAIGEAIAARNEAREACCIHGAQRRMFCEHTAAMQKSYGDAQQF